MFNPLSAFQPRYLGWFRDKGVVAFVKQTYERGKDPMNKTAGPAWLLNHFADIGHAIHHFDAIKYDPARKLYRLDNSEDADDLRAMLQTASDETFYTSLFTGDAQVRVKKALDNKIRTYINTKTDWKLNRGNAVKFEIYILFGEIYAHLENGSYNIRIKLSEIEKMA